MITQLQTILAEIVEPVAGARSEELQENFTRFIELLRARSRSTNITGFRDPNDIAINVIGDALVPLQNAPIDYLAEAPEELLDVGTGAGIPGLVYAIFWPNTNVVLLESQKKRIDFLNDAREELGLNNVEILEGRAETHAHELVWRERFDLVTSRAVGPLPIALELCLPFLALNGYFLQPHPGRNEKHQPCLVEPEDRPHAGSLPPQGRHSRQAPPARQPLIRRGRLPAPSYFSAPRTPPTAFRGASLFPGVEFPR
jgi:16S rRNA (guanine(527)-N(7))-methyltransferase RsmG